MLNKRDKLWINYNGDTMFGKCYCCGISINNKNFTVGHVIARALGGSDELSNLRPICSNCNSSMGTENLEDYKININLFVRDEEIDRRNKIEEKINKNKEEISKLQKELSKLQEETDADILILESINKKLEGTKTLKSRSTTRNGKKTIKTYLQEFLEEKTSKDGFLVDHQTAIEAFLNYVKDEGGTQQKASIVNEFKKSCTKYVEKKFSCNSCEKVHFINDIYRIKFKQELKEEFKKHNFISAL